LGEGGPVAASYGSASHPSPDAFENPLFPRPESCSKPALPAGGIICYCTREITQVRPRKRPARAAAGPQDDAQEDAMNGLLLAYLPILIFIGIAGALGLALILVPFVIAPQVPDPEKLSAYECGFNAFGDARMKFDVRFYLVSLLFIIFDLEVAFLFPWAITLGKTGVFGFWSMMTFLGVLTVGFIYEWKKGALEWE
jgi:NADH-quinone oxidoreductase subunit A